MYVPPLQKECPVCHHMVAINYVAWQRGAEVLLWSPAEQQR